MNYFQFFNLPVAFKIDEAALRRAFLLNSKKYHPDFFTLENETVQHEVLEKSTLNNEAWKTLSNFDRRVEYILKLKGKLADEGQNKLPQEFLMEMMDINENLMAIQFDFDADRFSETLRQVETIENQLFMEANPVFETWSDDSNNANDLDTVKDFFLKKKYLLRIKENLSKFAADFRN